jgi:hypothetical protein
MIEALDAGLAVLAAADVSVAPASLGDEICELYQRRDQLDAQIARRLVAYEGSGAYAEEQVTLPAWLRTQTTMGHGQSSAQVRVARLQNRLPILAAQWRAGKVTFAHWQSVSSGLRLLPESLWDEVDAPLAKVAPTMTARELGDFLRKLAEALLPTPKSKDETRHEARRLSVITGFDGMSIISGRLTPEVGEKLTSALSAASRPDAAGELRMPAQRKADALEHVLDCVLASATLPAEGGQKPHVALIVDLDQVDENGQLVKHDPTVYPTWVTDLPPAERQAYIRGVVDRLTATDGKRSRGPRFSWTGDTSVATARRLMCDGQVMPIFTRGGAPLDVGRGSRVVPWSLRAFIIARDEHCIWPHCTMPARWCDVHHLVHWADGGPTDKANLGLVCPHHHKAAHSGDYTVIVKGPGKIVIQRRTRPEQPLYRIDYDPAAGRGPPAETLDDALTPDAQLRDAARRLRGEG